MEFRFRAQSGNKTFDEPSYICFTHFLLCFLAGSLKMIKTLGLIEILACRVYSTTSPSPLLYTLYTFQNDPKAVSKKVWRSPQKSQTTWHVTLSIARQEQARPAEGIIEDLGDDVDSARLWPWGQRVNHYFLRPADAISQNTRKKDIKIFRKS